MGTSDEVADFIRESYSKEGVQVESLGEKSIVCSLPARFSDVGGFILDLEDRFLAVVDIELRDDNISLTVWCSDSLPKKTSHVWYYTYGAMCAVVVAAGLYCNYGAVKEGADDMKQHIRSWFV